MKKNQIALLCMTAVIMLAVWYIKSPIGKAKNTNPLEVSNKPVTRLVALKEMRDTLREERSVEVMALDNIISSESSTLEQKNNAIMSKDAISDLTEVEVLMELSLINLGYTDAFVHKSALGVDVLVIADSLSNEEVVDILSLVNNTFEDDSVVVSYRSASYYEK